LPDRKKTQILEKIACFLLTKAESDLSCGEKWERVVVSRVK
jgi:hypothetical protein